MNPPRYPASPAWWRRSFSSGVSGQVKPTNSAKAPYTTAGMCAQAIRGQRQARKTPPTTKLMNSRWTTTIRSAATRYHIVSPPGSHASRRIGAPPRLAGGLSRAQVPRRVRIGDAGPPVRCVPLPRRSRLGRAGSPAGGRRCVVMAPAVRGRGSGGCDHASTLASAGLPGVPGPGDGEPGPLRAGVLAPGRPVFSDRQMPGPEIAPGTDLVADTIGDTLVAPAPRSRRLQFRACRIRHAMSLSKAGTLHGVLLPPIGRPRSGPPGENAAAMADFLHLLLWAGGSLATWAFSSTPAPRSQWGAS